MLTAIRQNTISNVDIVSDNIRTEVWADENRNIEKMAISTPFRTVDDERGLRIAAPGFFMRSGYRVCLVCGDLFGRVASGFRFARPFGFPAGDVIGAGKYNGGPDPDEFVRDFPE